MASNGHIEVNKSMCYMASVVRFMVLLSVALPSLSCAGVPGKGGEKEQEMSNDYVFASDYVQMLEALAQKHHITREEARIKAMSLVHFGAPVVGPRANVISEDLYVPEGPRNSLVLKGKTWIGADRQDSEVVIIKGDKVESATRMGAGREARHDHCTVLTHGCGNFLTGPAIAEVTFRGEEEGAPSVLSR